MKRNSEGSLQRWDRCRRRSVYWREQRAWVQRSYVPRSFAIDHHIPYYGRLQQKIMAPLLPRRKCHKRAHRLFTPQKKQWKCTRVGAKEVTTRREGAESERRWLERTEPTDGCRQQLMSTRGCGDKRHFGFGWIGTFTGNR